MKYSPIIFIIMKTVYPISQKQLDFFYKNDVVKRKHKTAGITLYDINKEPDVITVYVSPKLETNFTEIRRTPIKNLPDE